MPGELICLHVGQAGCQIGRDLWELFCREHAITPSGRAEDPATGDVSGARPHSLGEQDDTSFHSLFSAKNTGQFVPRAILVDTDPSYKVQIEQSSVRGLFPSENLLAFKQDCRGNYAEGRRTALDYRVLYATSSCSSA